MDESIDSDNVGSDSSDNELNNWFKSSKLKSIKVTARKKNKTDDEMQEVLDQEDEIEEEIEGDEFDQEINYLEKELGIKDRKAFEKYKQSMTADNFDDDLFDFLDNIQEKVKQPKEVKPKKIAQTLEPKKINKQFEVPTKVNSQEDAKFDIGKLFTSQLNKISEGNISITIAAVLEGMEQSPLPLSEISLIFNDKVLKVIKMMTSLNVPISSCLSALVSAVHVKFGDPFMLSFLASFLRTFRELTEQSDSYLIPLKSLIFFSIGFMSYSSLSALFFYDFLNFLIDNFNSTNAELVFIMLKHIGIALRKEDPAALKDLIDKVNKKYATYKAEEQVLNKETDSTKLKIIVDLIDDLKNNKYLKFNLNERFSFLTGIVNNLKSGKSSEYTENLAVKFADLEEATMEDMFGDKKQHLTKSVVVFEEDSNGNKAKITKLAKKYGMNTDLKKVLFEKIVLASDVEDCFERLDRLGLNKEQQREIIKVLFVLVRKEKGFNPFYANILLSLITTNKDHKYTVNYCTWDFLKSAESLDEKEIHNLAKTLGFLLINEKANLIALKPIDLTSMTEEVFSFLFYLFDYYFARSDEGKTLVMFGKLIKDEQFEGLASNLLIYLETIFKKSEGFANKEERYRMLVDKSVKVLNKIK